MLSRQQKIGARFGTSLNVIGCLIEHLTLIQVLTIDGSSTTHLPSTLCRPHLQIQRKHLVLIPPILHVSLFVSIQHNIIIRIPGFGARIRAKQNLATIN